MSDRVKTISVDDYRALYDNSPAAKLIVDTDAPFFSILDVNNAYLTATHSKKHIILGQPLFAMFPPHEIDHAERVIQSFTEAIRTKLPHTINNYRYDLPMRGTEKFEERYWTTTNIPIMDEQDRVKYLIHAPVDVTELYKLRKKEEAARAARDLQRKQLHSVFMQAPVGIAIFKGADYIVDLINPPLCEIFGKVMDEIIGKPFFEEHPHIKGQGFEALLDNVRLTGKPYIGEASLISLPRNGKMENIYVNFVYEPWREIDGSISGVIAVAVEVTDQVLALNKIEEAEERARLAVEAVDMGTFDLDLQLGRMVTSSRLNKIFGFEQETVKRAEFISAIHPDDHAIRLAAHRKAMVSGFIFYEVRVIWKDGSIHWVRAEGKVYYDIINTPLRILGTLIDITEQKKHKEEQKKLLTLIDNSVDLMSILNLDGTNAYINKAGINLLGFKDLEQVPKIPFYVPEDYKFVENELLSSILKNGKWAGQINLRHLLTGEIFPVYNNAIRIDDPISGLPIAVGAVMRDLRPELKAKKALAESEQLLRNITTAAPIGLWMSDEHGAITYVNQTWVVWTGIEMKAQLGAGWLAAILPEDRLRAGEKFKDEIINRKLYEAQFRINHIDGSVHWCLATGQPQFYDDGTFSGYIGACMDITEQKHLQKQKDDFIGIASHELKTPVTSIKAYTQILERIFLKKGDLKEAAMIAKMDGQINRLTSLIECLLDVTKISSGKLQFNNRDFDFNLLVNEVIEDLQRTTEKKIIIESNKDIGIVYGDQERLGQVIINLISNAVKYSPYSGKIIVQSSLQAKIVTLSVQDFGIGISADNLKKVFERFYRVSGNMQHTFPGLGLGLYISAQIIKRGGGKLWVTSVEGKGSTFYFTIPAKQMEDSAGLVSQ
ncbi:MAG: PAS domain S-box protein [Sphingobacteriaceae bacterium]